MAGVPQQKLGMDGINQGGGGQRDRGTPASSWWMPLVKESLNEAERGVLKIMTVIMEELSAPSGRFTLYQWDEGLSKGLL